MKKVIFALGLILLLVSTSCQAQKPVCPTIEGTPVYLTEAPDLIPTPTPKVGSGLIPVKLGGKTLMVDQVVEGPLCNGEWSGTVYVGCNVQVYQWTLAPDFLSKCDLTIKPDTVVYVAHHNNTPYYNGCSCHTMTGTNP
jgi:hypothetical protein